jgi:hypothetical protein
MARKLFGPRKQRTRQHVIADQSVNHIERFIIDEGHAAQRLEKDYGSDLFLIAFDEEGYVEPGLVSLQLKAAETLPTVDSDYYFDLDVRDYNLWMMETWPVVLILFDASRRRAYWLHVQGYFRGNATRQPKKGAKTIRVRVPKRQVVNRRAIRQMRDLKQRVRFRTRGGQS